MSYVRSERISLKAHPELNEKWVQNLIAEDPSILGLGDLSLKDKERAQPHAGRLDLLLQDSDALHRYEVELQLGATDEAHIIRTIEYWDIERKRYPQYDHTAVIIAEDITSRFLNVLALFNGSIPLIALQMQALNVGDAFTLVFTKVVDELVRGPVDEDEEKSAPADRAYWEARGSKHTIALSDQLLSLVRKHDPSLTLNYTRSYIGFARRGQGFNFASLHPKKNHVTLLVKLPKTAEWDEKIEAGGLETLRYAPWGAYRLRITSDDVNQRAGLLDELLKAALDQRLT